MLSAIRCTWVVAAVSAAALSAGCGGPTGMANPGATLPAKEDSAAFLDRISSQPTVSENDAMRGVLMLLDGKDTAETFKQRVDRLLEREVVSASWSHDAARPTSRGKLAYMVFQAGKFSGGVVLALAGPSRRYCLRELRYQGLMGTGSQGSPVTGMEFVAVLGRADARIRAGKARDLAAEAQQTKLGK